MAVIGWLELVMAVLQGMSFQVNTPLSSVDITTQSSLLDVELFGVQKEENMVVSTLSLEKNQVHSPSFAKSLRYIQ